MNASQLRRLRLLLGLPILGAPLVAQDAPFHATLRDSIEQAGEAYSDVWGHGTEAYLGRFFQAEFDIVDISDPDNLAILSNPQVASPNNVASAQDIKVGLSAVDPGTRLAFVSFDAAGPDAVGIYDVTDPTMPTQLTLLQPDMTLFQTSHNVTYRDDGWLVICNSFSSDLAILDLTTYNPAAAPTQISSATYLLTNIGNTTPSVFPDSFVHDVTITDDYLFVAEWDELLVYDASDLSSGPPAFLGTVRGFACHAVWADEDYDYVVTSEERAGGGIRLWRMLDSGGTVTFEQTDSYVAPFAGTGAAYCAHNPIVFEDRIFTSYYGAGVQVHQIDRTDGTLELVASYDTTSLTSGGFDGCWGVDPRDGYETVLASDQDEGLHVIDFSGLEIKSFGTRPKTVPPFTPTTIRISIDGLGSASVNASTVTLWTSLNGGPFTATPMTNTFFNRYEADLPSSPCGGRIDYYFSADSLTAETFLRPAAAPTEFYTTYAALNLDVVFQDDFSTNKGWSVVDDPSVFRGTWERVVPVDSGMQPGNDDPNDAGSRCYVTENDPAGPTGDTSDYDLDGGPTTLTSPVMDFSAGDGLISYTRWQACDLPDVNDGLVVEISNDGGGDWTLVEDVTEKSGGWLRHTFRISDFVAPSATVQVRFRISDNPNDSVTEAGVDNFLAETMCTTPAATATFYNGTGANMTCFTTSPPVLGQNWTSMIDHSWRVNSTHTMVMIFKDTTSGLFFSGGEALLDPASKRFFVGIVPNQGPINTHTYPIPADIFYAGISAATQGVILGGNYRLCNAYTFTVGF